MLRCSLGDEGEPVAPITFSRNGVVLSGVAQVANGGAYTVMDGKVAELKVSISVCLCRLLTSNLFP